MPNNPVEQEVDGVIGRGRMLSLKDVKSHENFITLLKAEFCMQETLASNYLPMSIGYLTSYVQRNPVNNCSNMIK